MQKAVNAGIVNIYSQHTPHILELLMQKQLCAPLCRETFKKNVFFLHYTIMKGTIS